MCLAAGVLHAARPHYGGTLRIETSDAAVMRRVGPLSYETLVRADPSGGLRPALAVSWEADAQRRRWTFRLRPGVKLHDGSTLQAPQVVAALRGLHADWSVEGAADAVVIEPGIESPNLPSELAYGANAITIRSVSGTPVGSGPFRIDRVEGGLIALRAHDDYWGGRPFLDQVEIRTTRPAAGQLTDLETSGADMVQVQPTDVRRIEQRQLRVEASRPLELFVLAFEANLATAASEPARRTFAAAIDRGAITRVVLQGRAEAADGLLPSWISGYAPGVLAHTGDTLSRSAVLTLPGDRRTIALRVSPSDPAAQAIAQRVAVNARDAGFAVTVQAPAGLGPRFDVRLFRLPIRAGSPAEALSDVMASLGPRTIALTGRVVAPESAAPIETVLRAERSLLEHDVLVPIVHVPELYGFGPRVHSWNGPVVLPSGAWNLADVWLSAP